jgi:hypothetical protein
MPIQDDAELRETLIVLEQSHPVIFDALQDERSLIRGKESIQFGKIGQQEEGGDA